MVDMVVSGTTDCSITSWAGDSLVSDAEMSLHPHKTWFETSNTCAKTVHQGCEGDGWKQEQRSLENETYLDTWSLVSSLRLC